MEGIGVQILGFIFSLSILVVLHELGHFIPAKLFKTKVEKFYLFFNPWFSLFKFKKGETEYGVGWLPLGGYVKIAGMIDESMDKDQMKEEPKEWEFRSKPTWQRLIIMIGGVAVNAFLAWFIYSMILFAWGDRYIKVEDIKDGFAIEESHPFMANFDLKTGDKIIKVGDESPTRLTNLYDDIINVSTLTVERKGKEVIVDVPKSLINDAIDNNIKLNEVISIRMPFLVGEVVENTAAEKAGLSELDVIKSVNGTEITYFDELRSILKTVSGEEIELVVQRGAEELSMYPVVSDSGTIGFRPGIYSLKEMHEKGFYNISNDEYSLIASFGGGYDKVMDKLGRYARMFKMILNPSTGAYKGLGGFKTMGSLFPTVWDWEAIWELTAYLSIILAFMNLLPIPALDGGHVMFLLYEIIARRKPSEKFLERAQMVGMIILISLMLFANLNDTIFAMFR